MEKDGRKLEVMGRREENESSYSMILRKREETGN